MSAEQTARSAHLTARQALQAIMDVPGNGTVLNCQLIAAEALAAPNAETSTRYAAQATRCDALADELAEANAVDMAWAMEAQLALYDAADSLRAASAPPAVSPSVEEGAG